MTKSELRKIYLARQKEFLPAERNEKSEQISNRFFTNFDLKNVRFLHCFIAIEKFNEIDTSLILKRLWRDFPHIKTIVPRVDFQTNRMESLIFGVKTELEKNDWEIREPVESESVAADEIDAVLVPLLCFDARGFRVGYGKGFYDRFLKNCREDCLRIGLSYFAPVEEISDARDFDVRLDFCVTPEKVFTTKTLKNTKESEN